MTEPIPLVDVAAQHLAIRDQLRPRLEALMDSGAFVLGPEVEAFEAEFAGFTEAAHAVGVDSGLSALELGLRALDIGPGDEVITPANSFIASSAAISFTGATPVWVDADPITSNLDLDGVRRAIGARTRAIMPVHLYGRAADMASLLRLAREHGLKVIEDACQAHGARHGGRRVGALGDVGAFSFYPGKNLGAYGDGGAVVTNDAEIAGRVRMLRNYGQRRKYEHAILGWNRRLDAMQAAVLRVKLARLDRWNEARRRHAAAYDALLADGGLTLPAPSPPEEHVFHLYVVQVDDRDAVLRRLASAGVHAGIHYPVPIHLQEAYAALGAGPGSFPVTEAQAGRCLSLPMYPELTREQVERVARALLESVSAGARA